MTIDKKKTKDIIQSNFELLADDIVDILIDMEMKCKVDKSGVLIMTSEFLEALSNKFDKALHKRLNQLLLQLES